MRNIKVNLPVCGEEVEVFAPSVKTFKAVSAEKTEIEQSIKLCAACANKTPAQIEELDIGAEFFGRLAAPDNENIALLGYVLHFSYSEILMMDIVDFSEFVSIALKILKAQSGALKA